MGTDVYFGESCCEVTVAEQADFLAKEGKTFVDYCNDMGWKCDINNAGAVIGITADCIRYGPAEAFFRGIAPYIKKTSHYVYEDEDQYQGVFVIENGEVRQNQYDRHMINWEEPPLELLKQLIRAHIEHSDADAVRRLVDETIAATVMET